MRQTHPAVDDRLEFDRVPRPVVAVVRDYPHGHIIPPHRHGRNQLVYASRGVMTVTAESGTWVVPPQRAVWMPGGVVHTIRMQGAVAMRTLYVAQDALAESPRLPRVVQVPALLRELILAAAELPRLYDEDGAEGRLMAVLLDRLRTLPTAPLHLPLPEDRRARRVADSLVRTPGDGRDLDQWGREVGASRRTLARLFARETGMAFRAWRQQCRLLASLERLAAGTPVTEVALDLGYESPSAFIAMFRRALGVTPGRYFRRQVAVPPR